MLFFCYKYILFIQFSQDLNFICVLFLLSLSAGHVRLQIPPVVSYYGLYLQWGLQYQRFIIILLSVPALPSASNNPCLPMPRSLSIFSIFLSLPQKYSALIYYAEQTHFFFFCSRVKGVLFCNDQLQPQADCVLKPQYWNFIIPAPPHVCLSSEVSLLQQSFLSLLSVAPDL